MRVFSRLLLVVSVAGLALSAWLAPRIRADAARSAESGLLIADGMERGRMGDEQRALGLALEGFGDVLASDPTNIEAINGLMRAGVRLSAVTIGRPGVSDRIGNALAPYLQQRSVCDPDGAALEAALQEYVELRLHNKWYVVRGTTALFLAARGDARGLDELRELMRQGPYWREYFPAVLRYLPTWSGVEPIAREFLEGDDPAGRVAAGIVLMTYRRLFGVGEELWRKHRLAIGEAALRRRNSLLPDEREHIPDHPGGQTLLALALYDTPTTDRIVEQMKAVEHPYLPRVVAIAKLWAGFGEFDAVDFDNPRYSSWSDMEREYFYRGVLYRYAEQVRDGNAAKAEALREGPIADALVSATDSVRITARRVLAALHPDRADAIHREMYEAGSVQRLFAVFAIPGADWIDALLPALTSPDPSISTLAAVGMLQGDGPPPIQLPVR